MASNKLIASAFRWSGTTKVLGGILQLFRTILLVFLIQPKSFGIVALLAVFINIGLHVQESCVNSAIIFFKKATYNILSNLYVINIVLGFTLFVSACFSTLFLYAIYREDTILQLMPFYSSIFLINGITNQYKTLLHKELQFKNAGLSELFGIASGIAVSIILAYNRWEEYAIVLGILVQYTTSGVFFWWYSKSTLHLFKPFQFDSIRPYIRYGIRHILERVINMAVNYLDILLISTLFGLELLGIYDVLKRLISRPAGLLSLAGEQVIFPILAKIKEKDALFEKLYLQLLSVLLLILSPIYIFSIPLAPVILDVFDYPWNNSIVPFCFLALFTLIQVILNPIDTALLAMGKIKYWTYANLIFAFPYAGLMIVGSIYGFEGFLIGILIAHLLLIIGSFWFILNPLRKMNSYSYLFTLITPILIAALSSIPLFFMLGSTIEGLLIGVVTSATIYLALVYFTKRETLLVLCRLFQ